MSPLPPRGENRNEASLGQANSTWIDQLLSVSVSSSGGFGRNQWNLGGITLLWPAWLFRWLIFVIAAESLSIRGTAFVECNALLRLIKQPSDGKFSDLRMRRGMGLVRRGQFSMGRSGPLRCSSKDRSRGSGVGEGQRS